MNLKYIFFIICLGTIGYCNSQQLQDDNTALINAYFNQGQIEQTQTQEQKSSLFSSIFHHYLLSLICCDWPIRRFFEFFLRMRASNDVEKLNSLSMQSDFLLKEFAIFNKALVLVNEGKYKEAKVALTLIPKSSKAHELSALLEHYLLTK